MLRLYIYILIKVHHIVILQWLQYAESLRALSVAVEIFAMMVDGKREIKGW